MLKRLCVAGARCQFLVAKTAFTCVGELGSQAAGCSLNEGEGLLFPLSPSWTFGTHQCLGPKLFPAEAVEK